jgi:carbonic anhydrase
MNKSLQIFRLIWLKHDLPAGLSVFLVALPLCLGIALASGAPLVAGLISGIIGGVIVSLISGSALGVSGPAAGLSTLVAAAIVSLGDYQTFLLAVIIAGAFQMVLGIFKMGGIANYFPSSVIKGMLAAIGIILISKQIPIALGYGEPDFFFFFFLNLFTADSIHEHFKDLGSQVSEGSSLLSVLSIIILILLQRPFAKKIKMIPAPLIVVLFGVVFNYLLSIEANAFSLSSHQLVNIPSNVFSQLIFPDVSKIFSNGEVWKSGLVIGLLATLETLLCVEAVDKLDKKNRITPVNRELIAQGIGNMACGFLGGIPITAVVVRGAANVDAGGRTKLSAFTHGIFLLLAVLFIPFILNKIPYASLAAILLMTGYNLAKPKLFKNMIELGMKQFLPFIITIIVILSTDLLIGVTIGLIISIYFIIQNNFKAEYKVITNKKSNTSYSTIKLNSNVSFLNKVKLRRSLDEISEYSVLTIDGSECNFIDYDILEIIGEFDEKAKDRHIEVILKGIEKVNVNALH